MQLHTTLSKLLVALMLGSFVLAATPALAASGQLSGNWAGYVAGHGQYSAVGASWSVPTLAATTTLMTDVTWVGIGGSKSHDLIQAGTHSVVQKGYTQYWAWYELLPDYQVIVPLSVRGGDAVEVSMTEVTPDLWYISFENKTTGARYGKVLTYRSDHASAEWIEEMPSVYGPDGEQEYAPLSEFGAVTISHAYAVVGGKRVGVGNARASGVTMVAESNRSLSLATPSDITDDSFVVTRSSAVPSPLATQAGTRRHVDQSAIVWTNSN